MKRGSYTVETCPPRSEVSVRILMACRIARRFTHRLPTVGELREEFGMSEATAYRWIAAMRLAQKAA